MVMHGDLTDDVLAGRLRVLLASSTDLIQRAASQQRITIERQLSDGYTNSNHLLRCGEQRCVLRLGNPAAARLGINRSREQAIWRNAASAGLSPKLLAFDEAVGDAVSVFIDAPSAADLLASGESLSSVQLARLLKRIHSLPAVASSGSTVDSSPTRNVDRYVALGKHAGLHWPGWLATLQARLKRIHADAPAVTLTHHDFNPWNVLVGRDGQNLMLDWEYAELGDPMFDLVSAFVHWNMNADARNELLAAYDVGTDAATHIASLECLFHLREFTWAGAMLALGSNNANVQEQWDREADWLTQW